MLLRPCRRSPPSGGGRGRHQCPNPHRHRRPKGPQRRYHGRLVRQGVSAIFWTVSSSEVVIIISTPTCISTCRLCYFINSLYNPIITFLLHLLVHAYCIYMRRVRKSPAFDGHSRDGYRSSRPAASGGSNPQTNDGACNSSTPPPEMAAPLRPGRSTPKAGEMSDNFEGARSPRYWQNFGQIMYDFGRGHTHRHTDRQNFYIVSIMKSWNRGIHQTNKYRDTNRIDLRHLAFFSL